MRGRRTNCLLAALLMTTMTVSHQAPGARASLILRGRWTASIDEVDTISGGTIHGDAEHLRGVVRLLRDHQRRRPDLTIERFPNLKSVNRLLQAFEHQTDEASEARENEDRLNAMQFSSGEDARSVDMVSRLLGSAGDHRDSLTADESDRSRMEEYQDEVRRITDAIADSGWYADDELMNEDDYGTGILNPFQRKVESPASLQARTRRIRLKRTIGRTVGARNAATHCDKLRHLVNESCNSLPHAVKSCQSYLMCIACNAQREDECALRHVSSSESPCVTSGDDVTVDCRKDAQQLHADMHRVLPVDVGACAAHVQCTRFRVA